MKKAKRKKIMALMLLGGFIFITGCCNQRNISTSQVIGGAGIAVGTGAQTIIDDKQK